MGLTINGMETFHYMRSLEGAKIKETLIIVPKESGVNALVVRDASDSEDRVKITEDGKIVLRYGAIIKAHNSTKISIRNPDDTIFINLVTGYHEIWGDIIFSGYVGRAIKAPPYGDVSLQLWSHDGSAYRTTLKLIGGRMEVYSWDGSAEQLVAKTNAGYLELARAKLTGHLNANNFAITNVGYIVTNDTGDWFEGYLLFEGDVRGGLSNPYDDYGEDIIALFATGSRSVGIFTKDPGGAYVKRLEVTGGEDVARVRIRSGELWIKPDSSDLFAIFDWENESYARFMIKSNGRIEWGDGAGARDVVLYRAAADILQTDDEFRAWRVLSNRGSLPHAKLTDAGFVETHPLNADETNTTRDSPSIGMYAKYWDGSQSVARDARIFHRMLSTTPASEIVFQIEGDNCFTVGDSIVRSYKPVEIQRPSVTDALALKVSGDTYSRMLIYSNGKIEWGDGANPRDVLLYRYTEKTLGLEERLYIKSATDPALAIFKKGEIYARLWIYGSGKLEWGNGSGTPDANLYRAGPDILQTDDIFRCKEITTNKGNPPYGSISSLGNVFLRGPNATESEPTQDSPYVLMRGFYWDGTQSLGRDAMIIHHMIDTTPKSEIVFQIEDVDVGKFKDDGRFTLKRVDIDDYGGNFANYSPPSTNVEDGDVLIAVDTNASAPGVRIYVYANGAWHYVNLS